MKSEFQILKENNELLGSKTFKNILKFYKKSQNTS